MREISVGCEHGQVVADTKLCQQGVYRSNVHTRAATAIAQVRGPDVIVAIGYQQRDSGESIQNLRARARPQKTLEQLLQHQACRENDFPALNRPR